MNRLTFDSIRLALVVGVLLTFAGCKNEGVKLGYSGISEGVIEYELSYPYLDSNDIGLNLLPNLMTMSFKNNNYRVESVGGMGLFVTGYVSRSEKRQMDYFLKIVSSKFASRFNNKGLKHLNKDFPPYRLEEIDTTKDICGYKCKGYRVVYYNNVVEDHEVWYTREIDLQDPNWCSPFPKVNGVMMAYQFQRNGLVVNFTAQRVIDQLVEDDLFHVPLDYKVISNRTLIRKMEEAFIGFDY